MIRQELMLESDEKIATDIEEQSYCQSDLQNANQITESKNSLANDSNENLLHDNNIERNDGALRVIHNLRIKKTIAKLSKSQSKRFTKKQLMIVPYQPLFKEISQDHLITLYGCLEVETYYKDYEDPFHDNLILYVERMHSPIYVVKDFQLSVVDIVLNPLSSCGIVDFQFLIDRFIKMQNQDYLELAQELTVYQYIVKSYLLPQISIQKAKMIKSAKKKEDFAQLQEQFVKYFKQWIKDNLDPSAFYDYELYRTNYITGEIELFKSGFSFSLCSLLGIEINQIENLVYRGQNYYNEKTGDFRLKFFLLVMQALNNEIKETEPQPFILRTYDGIVINCKVVLQQVTFDDRPSWIEKYDLYGLIIRFDISVQQIKAILDIRTSQNNLDLEQNSVQAPFSVEYQMYSELFLEKFYPELFNSNIFENDKNNKQNRKPPVRKGIVIS
ncbi:hypothetical protein TTHERM_00420470 (macronuclear) [Tetrahymena thermophila SB210]|uniref:Uncharacterized protein n=1 Tax=Tetrahymena thermophila (strain SB210) TaxID=312017 RepID=I7M079_TETTS|nr:hypothetical protein TTHERM_00420470 [Tetrahymena thermophila SB210]EAR85639.1 hypothetical protein TTHERM_00420470 [Tetrahymena thermophila SB210]|eukprot:XP_001033302.1 hypothetical protein TTHERM_00420470 [Tetrahymena thermophila SB210]